jgi:hypothetical protein
MMVEVAGATAQGVVDRQRPLTASWLGFDLPSAVAPRASVTLAVKQVKVTSMPEGDRYDFEYQWNLRNREVPGDLNVEVIGARDIRITNMEKHADKSSEGMVVGSFSLNTTKNTLPADYDIIVRGKLKSSGRDEDIYARPLILAVTEKKATADASNAQ